MPYSEVCKHLQLPQTSSETAALPSSEAREKQVQISEDQPKEHVKDLQKSYPSITSLGTSLKSPAAFTQGC